MDNTTAGITQIIIGVAYLGVAVALGYATKHINESKGYKGGFAWGFWLSIIGVIVVACKPDNHSNSQLDSAYSILEKEAKDRQMLNDGGWKCSCGRINPSYTSTCACGRHKYEQVKPKEDSSISKSNEVGSEEIREVMLIKHLTELRSQGILTDEEFKAKKLEVLQQIGSHEKKTGSSAENGSADGKASPSIAFEQSITDVTGERVFIPVEEGKCMLCRKNSVMLAHVIIKENYATMKRDICKDCFDKKALQLNV